MKLGVFSPMLLLFSSVSLVPAEPPAPSRLTEVDSEAIVVEWTPPEYPADAKAAKIEGQSVVQFVVDESGHVTSAEAVRSTDPRFAAPAVAAVRKWKFAAAEESGRKVTSANAVAIVFQLKPPAGKSQGLLPPNQPKPLSIKPPRSIFQPKAAFPEEIETRLFSGSVVTRFFVNEQGQVENPTILGATHAALVAPTLAALAQSQFEPARQGPVARRGSVRQVVEFSSALDDRAAILEADGITAAGGAPLSTLEGGLPLPQCMIEPIYPRELLLAGEAGEAVIEFTLTGNGLVRDIVPISATNPEFSRALVAAAELWSFTPSILNGRATEPRLRAKQSFAPPEAGDQANPTARLLAALKSEAGIPSTQGLDRPLTPRWLFAPTYPRALRDSAPHCEAVIEIIVDRDGRVRLPKIVSATHPEYGMAAATAASQGVFVPPTRHGQPTDVRVRVPFSL